MNTRQQLTARPSIAIVLTACRSLLLAGLALFCVARDPVGWVAGSARAVSASAVAAQPLPAGESAVEVDLGLLVSRVDAPNSLAAHCQKIAGEQTILSRVREMPDQSFEQAMHALWRPAQNHGPTMLSLACDNAKFIVERDGAVRFGQLVLRPRFPLIYLSDLYARQAQPQVTRQRTLEDRWLPIVVNSTHSGDVVLRQRTWVAPRDDSPGNWDGIGRTRALGVTEISVENPGSKPVEVSLRLDRVFPSGPPDNPPLETQTAGDRVLWLAGDRLVSVLDLAKLAPLSAVVDLAGVHIGGQLPAASACRFVVYIPAWTCQRDEHFQLPPVAVLRERVSRYWQELLDPAMQIALPEPLLEDVYRATQVHCLMAARNEADGRRVAPWIASDAYGPLDTEAQPVILGMSLVGQEEFARRGLDFFVASYNADGLLAKGYTLMGTGQHLWTLRQHCAIHPDPAWLDQIAPEILKSCRWIVRQAEKTKQLDASGQPVPEYGLAPPGVLADWDRYAYYLYANAYYCAGLGAATDLLASVRPQESAALQQAAGEYREDVLRAFHWQRERMPVVPLRDGTWVSPAPSSLYCYGLTREFFGGVSAIGHDVEVGSNHLIPLGWLAPFVTTNWLQPGMQVSGTQAPSRFGSVSYKLVSAVADGYMEAVIQPPTRRPPARIVLRVRHPDGKPMRSVTVDAQPHIDFEAAAQLVYIAPTDKPMTVRISY